MIAVLNCGSQSLKCKVFDADFNTVSELEKELSSDNYKEEIRKELKKIKSFKIERVGHRVVHGGSLFRDPIEINSEKLSELKKMNHLAPLHNPNNILGIELSKEIFPEAKQIAVFDTGFYKNIPEKAFRYPLPKDIVDKYQFRRYGFHGISHEYVAKKGAKEAGLDFNNSKIISCHLGGGSSVTAIKNGTAVDTSMGHTPLEGLPMTTRVGDLDPGIMIELSKDFSAQELNDLLSKKSGMKAVSGISKMKEVVEKAKKGDKKAALALDIFIYKLKKYIGSYYFILNGCDLLIFTGGIGYNFKEIEGLLRESISVLESVKIIRIKTNEELMIAKKSCKI